MNKYKNEGIGLNASSSDKREANILDKAGRGITGRPDAVLFRKDEEKILHEKINETNVLSDEEPFQLSYLLKKIRS